MRLHRLYVWDISHYSGKARGYMRYKQIPHFEMPMNLFDFLVTAKVRGGDRTIPAVVTPDGEWLQDTKEIIDTLEQRYPERPVLPETPVQRMAAYLFELWADEVLPQMSIHTRWSNPENYPRFRDEVGYKLIPMAPKFVQDRLVDQMANFMKGNAMGFYGIRGEQIPVLDAWMERMLDALERHFTEHAYLLGGRPSIADFGLLGTMFGHLSQDPWPKHHLINPRPEIKQWIARMSNPPETVGDYFPDDKIPPTLDEIFKDITEAFLPFLQASIEYQLQKYTVSKGRMPRVTAGKRFPMKREGTLYKWGGQSIHLWMVQRILDDFHTQPKKAQDDIRAWLKAFDAEAFLDLSLPRVERAGLCARFV